MSKLDEFEGKKEKKSQELEFFYLIFFFLVKAT